RVLFRSGEVLGFGGAALSQRGAAPTGERRCARLLLCGPLAARRCSYRRSWSCSSVVGVAPPLRTARNARPQAAINRRRKEVSGGTNTQHQPPPGQSSRTDTISRLEEERANRKFCVVGRAGFEPATNWLKANCSTS